MDVELFSYKCLQLLEISFMHDRFVGPSYWLEERDS